MPQSRGFTVLRTPTISEDSWFTSEKSLTPCPHRLFQVVSAPKDPNGIAVLACGVCVAREILEPQSFGWLIPAVKKDFSEANQQLQREIRALKEKSSKLNNAKRQAPSQYPPS
jgi:hypothetical protein